MDGTTGEVRPLAEAQAPATADHDARAPIPVPVETLAPASAAEEAFHVLEAHPLARESVYVNAQDPASGTAIVASVGARPRGEGEALLAIALRDGRVLFALEREDLERGGASVRVGGAETAWAPVRLRYEGGLSVHEGASFPPGPLPLALAPRVARVRFDLAFTPTTPAVDFTQGLEHEDRRRLLALGAHHVEQSGRWQGVLEIDGHAGRPCPCIGQFDGTGSRDHSWGRRDWSAAEWWRLFTVRLGDDLAAHGLAVSVNGHVVEGGFVWRDGRAERVRRVAWTEPAPAPGSRRFELELGTARGPVRLRGEILRTLTVPVQLARRPGRLIAGRPWRLLLHENYTRYSCDGRTGHGMAEFTERP